MPLSQTFYVDRGSASPTENGSIGAPFKTIGAGLVALGAAGGTLLVVPADYSGEPSRAVNLTNGVTIQNVAGAQAIVGANQVTLPALTATAAAPLVLEGCATGTVAMVAGTLQLNACLVGGAVTGCSVAVVRDCLVSASFAAAIADFFHCVFTNTGNLVTATFTVDFESCDFTGNGAVSVTFSGAPGALYLDAMSGFTYALSNGTVINGSTIYEATSATPVHLVAQSTAVALTNVYPFPPRAGLYLVAINIEVTTTGTAGTISPNVASRGDGSTSLTQTGNASGAISGLNVTSTVFLARCNGNTHLQYGTTFNGVTVGSLRYSVSVAAQRLSE